MASADLLALSSTVSGPVEIHTGRATAGSPVRASSTSAGYVEAASHHGYAGPWGIEVLSGELRKNPIDVIFRRAYDTTARRFEHERSRA